MSPEPARPEPHEQEPESPSAEPHAQSWEHKESPRPPTWFLWERIFHRATNAAGKSHTTAPPPLPLHLLLLLPIRLLRLLCEDVYLQGRLELGPVSPMERDRGTRFVEFWKVYWKLQRPFSWDGKETCSPLTTPVRTKLHYDMDVRGWKR
jgi:hypothetical protein